MSQQTPHFDPPVPPYGQSASPYGQPVPPYGQPVPPYGQPVPPAYQPPSNMPPPRRPVWVVPVIVVAVAVVVGLLGLMVGHYVWSQGPVVTPESTETITPTAPAPTEPPVETSLPPSQPTVTQPVCPSGITLPAGVDPMVCGGMPGEAISGLKITAPDGTEAPGFGLPGGDIGCDSEDFGDGFGTECLGSNPTWTMPPDLVQACYDANVDNPNAGQCQGGVIGLISGAPQVVMHGDVTPWQNALWSQGYIPVLQAGQVADLAPVACLSGGDSVTCWDTTTHHGFQMGQDRLIAW